MMTVLLVTDFLPSEALKASKYFLRVKKWFPNMLFCLDSLCIIVALFYTRPIWDVLNFVVASQRNAFIEFLQWKKEELILEVLRFPFDFCECYRCLGIKLSLSFVLRQSSLMRKVFFYIQCRNRTWEGWSRTFLCFELSRSLNNPCSFVRRFEIRAKKMLGILFLFRV